MSQSDEDERDSQSDTLVEQCEVCRDLSLDIDNFIVRPSQQPSRRRKPSTFNLVSSTASIELGTFDDISERHSRGCNFCGLVLASAKTSSSQGSNEHRTRSSAKCYMRWEIDGRRASATGGPNVGLRAPEGITRRIRLHWNEMDLEDAYLVAVAQQRYLTTLSDAHRAWSSDSLFLGRRIDHDGLNQARLNSWTNLCKTHHPHPCNDLFGTETPQKFRDMLTHSYFGVIDVINMQLVQLPTFPSRQGPRPASYAALSYVWGEDKKAFRTMKDNVNALRMHGGLERFMSELPPVIRDAIDLVRRLDLQFIWIDALCIIQDSEDSWRLNAYNMDVIYGNAELTICAADGDGADTGLKAARPSATRTPQIAECGEDLYLMLVRTPESYIKASTWNTRAWTFQERLMSRRCLIFVDGRVFFQCPSTGMSEDIYADRDGTGWSLDLVDAPMRMFRQMSERSFWVYMELAQLYSSRKLTKKKDILAAFWGITIRMERIMQAPFIFGLPSSHFDLAILWQHTGPASRREPTSDEELLEYAGHRFPTWSWTGWTGPPISYSHDMLGDCLDNTNEWLTNHTWIHWYIRDGTGDLRPLWNKSTWRNDYSRDVKWQGYGHKRTSGAHIPTDYTERRNGWTASHVRDILLIERAESSSRTLTHRYFSPESRYNGGRETHNDDDTHRPLEYPPEEDTRWIARDSQPDTSRSQPPENNNTPTYRRDEQLQRHDENFPGPTRTYTHPDDLNETRSQRPQLQRQGTEQRVGFEDDVAPRQKFENGEAEVQEVDGFRSAPRVLSQRWEARSTGSERERELVPPNYIGDQGRDELKPKYDDMFMPDEEVRPWHTESSPEFFISPKEYPYPPVIHPYNRDPNSGRSPLMPLLQFWTWYAQLNIAYRPKEAPTEENLHPGLQRCSIADDNGDWCGSIVLNRRWVRKCKYARQELIAISEAKAFSLLECESWTYYIPKERHESEWDVFYVLLIERKEEKWERVGLGKVFKEAFMRTAQWREIMLS